MENNATNITIERKDTENKAKTGFYNIIELTINKKVTLQFFGMGSGCGTVEMKGNKYLYNLTNEEIEVLADYLKNKFSVCEGYISYLPGLIIAIHGETTSSEEQLKALGFIVLSEHSNWQDGMTGNYMQKLYGLKTNYCGIINKGT